MRLLYAACLPASCPALYTKFLIFFSFTFMIARSSAKVLSYLIRIGWIGLMHITHTCGSMRGQEQGQTNMHEQYSSLFAKEYSDGNVA